MIVWLAAGWSAGVAISRDAVGSGVIQGVPWLIAQDILPARRNAVHVPTGGRIACGSAMPRPGSDTFT